jgi:hypothetical protein
MAVQLAFEVGSVFTPGAPINDRELFAGRLNQVQQILSAVSQRGYHAVLRRERRWQNVIVQCFKRSSERHGCHGLSSDPRELRRL